MKDKILVIDDEMHLNGINEAKYRLLSERDLALEIKSFFESQNFFVVFAKSGEEGLEIVMKDKQKNIKIILLDIIFTEIKKRINELEKYNKESTTGELEKYTKKERVVMAKKMEKLARYYTGLLSLKKAPDAIYIVDAKAEHIAATEARKSCVPVVALVNSDSNIKGIDYPIVCNDAAIPSIKIFTDSIVKAYKMGQMSTPIKK